MPLSRHTTGDRPGSTKKRMPLARRFTLRYALALVLFGALVVSWRWADDAATKRITDLTQHIEQASTQPGRLTRVIDLSEKIALGQSAATIDGDTSQLEQEASLLVRVQDGLLQGDPQLELPPIALPPALDQLYRDPERLASTIRDISASAKQIAKAGGTQATDAKRAQLELIQNARKGAESGLDKAVKLYTDEIQRELRTQESTNTVFSVLAVLLAAFVVAGLFRPMARNIHRETSQLEAAEREARENNLRQTFRNNLAQALEMAQDEDDVVASVGRAFADVIPEHPAELLLADPSQANLRRAQVSPTAGAAHCPVESPEGCIAIRRGQSATFETSRMLNVCPRVPEHPQGLCSAVCVPVVFLGRTLGVVHATGPDGAPPSSMQIERLKVLAREAGNRLGTLEVTKVTQLQATTDGLTGLFNRRTLETKARNLLMDERPFSIAMADLDHFKSLNDTHGHEAGDRALRLFASVLSANLRPNDVPGRYGGEEFIVILPGTSIREAHAAIDRLQTALAEEIARTGMIPFTASWGLTDNGAGQTFDEIVAVADAALYGAKRAGRNYIMVDGVAAATAGWSPDTDTPTVAVPQPPSGAADAAAGGEPTPGDATSTPTLTERDLELLRGDGTDSNG